MSSTLPPLKSGNLNAYQRVNNEDISAYNVDDSGVPVGRLLRDNKPANGEPKWLAWFEEDKCYLKDTSLRPYPFTDAQAALDALKTELEVWK